MEGVGFGTLNLKGFIREDCKVQRVSRVISNSHLVAK